MVRTDLDQGMMWFEGDTKADVILLGECIPIVIVSDKVVGGPQCSVDNFQEKKEMEMLPVLPWTSKHCSLKSSTCSAS